MKKLSGLMFLGMCLATAASAATIYTVNGTDLYEVNVTGSDFTFTNLGAITGVTGTITDIAELNGVLYVTTDSALYKLSGDVATEVGSGYVATDSMVALTFGISPTTGQPVLYGAASGSATDYYTINTTTGVATAVATSPSSEINAAGDLEVIGDDLYVTTGGLFGPSSLGYIDLLTGAFTSLGEIHDSSGTDFDDVYGLAVANGVLYGFTDTAGQILDFGSISGTITSLVTVVPSGDITDGVAVYGATDDVTTAPEPATLGVMGLGLLALGGFRYRRRKA